MQLTDNCLADARLDADDLWLDRRRLCLLELVTEAASLVGAAGHRWRLTLDGQPPPAGERWTGTAWLDPAMMRIALSNVIDNAVKYGNGGPRVDVSRHADHWSVAIRDQGSGIAEDRVPVIFERYRRAAPAEHNHRRGVGLGLYVSRRIARAHGGDLVLADNGDHGCCFLFTLPLPPEEEASH